MKGRLQPCNKHMFILFIYIYNWFVITVMIYVSKLEDFF